VALLTLLAGLTPCHSEAQAHKLGLLVGVGNYLDPNIRLEGAVPDVQALHKVLTERWGYDAGPLHTLIDGQATRSGILAELQGLMQRSQTGDEILIYLSGHGTSALDPGLGLPIPDGSGAFVPYDFDARPPHPERTLLIGRTDLRPVLEALDRAGRKVWVISDSCYSGRQVRGMHNPARLPQRMIQLPLPASRQLENYEKARERLQSAAAAPEPWPYRNVTFLAAAAIGEGAVDISAADLPRYPTLDGRPHGALTDALLRVLHGKEAVDFNGDGQASLNEIYAAVSKFMSQRTYSHTPQRLPSVEEDKEGVGNRPLLSGRNLATLPRQDRSPTFAIAVPDTLPPAARQAVAALPGVVIRSSDAEIDLRISTTPSAGKLDLFTRQGDLITRLPITDTARLTGQIQQIVWAEQLDHLARQGQRNALPAEISPATLGGNFLPGDKLHFTVMPDRDAVLLLLNMDAEGKVSVLYPFNPGELAPLPGGQRHRLPSGPEINVTEPLGMDLQLLFAFDTPPPSLERWVGRKNLPASDPDLIELQRIITSQARRYTYARTELRVLPRPTRP
jgi:hypothetical protein